ncbi:MAG: hypothetical protein Q7S47_00260 [bacterium]|nr:hypothetical protein [bacterium]
MFSIEGTQKQEKWKQPIGTYFRSEYFDYIPTEFKDDPKKYINENGVNIKSGEIEFHENGSIKEDPAAAKFLPWWYDVSGNVLAVVSKKVNSEKNYTKTDSNARRTVDLLLEYRMMCLCKILNLPTANPIGYTMQSGDTYIIMERVRGLTWTKKDFQKLKEQGLPSGGKELIRNQIEILMQELNKVFEKFGIFRKWKQEDMIFDFDNTSNRVTKITPVDWEWAHLDMEKLAQNTASFSPEIQQEIQVAIHKYL